MYTTCACSCIHALMQHTYMRLYICTQHMCIPHSCMHMHTCSHSFMYTFACTQAVVEADRTLDNLTIANEKLRVDIEKWQEAKDQEMASLCSTFADNHINYHQKVCTLPLSMRGKGEGLQCHVTCCSCVLQCFNEWEKVLTMLRDPKYNSRRGGEDTDPQNEGSPLARRPVAEASGATPTIAADFERSNSPELFT